MISKNLPRNNEQCEYFLPYMNFYLKTSQIFYWQFTKIKLKLKVSGLIISKDELYWLCTSCFSMIFGKTY